MENPKDLAQLIAEAISCKRVAQIEMELSDYPPNGILASVKVPHHLRHLYLLVDILTEKSLEFVEKNDQINSDQWVLYSEHVEDVFGSSLEQQVPEIRNVKTYIIISDWRIVYYPEILN